MNLQGIDGLLNPRGNCSSSSAAHTRPTAEQSPPPVLSIDSSLHPINVKLSYIIHPPSLRFTPFSSSPIWYPTCGFSGPSIVCCTGQMSAQFHLLLLTVWGNSLHPVVVSTCEENYSPEEVRCTSPSDWVDKMSTEPDVTANVNNSGPNTNRKSSLSSPASSNSSTPTPELYPSQQFKGKIINGGYSNDYSHADERKQSSMNDKKLENLIKESIFDMSCRSPLSEKSAILPEIDNQTKKIKSNYKESDAVQQSDVSSSRPHYFADYPCGASFLEVLNLNSIPAGVDIDQRTQSFNCQFAIKKGEGSMEEQKYENMQVSSAHLRCGDDKAEHSESDSEGPKRIVCIAHRVVSTDKSNNTDLNTPLEQFTTRLLINGKILSVDTSQLATYSQYLNKDLVGRFIHSLCHSSDRQIFDQHWSDVMQNEKSTSNVYKLQLSPEKYIHVKTSSKRYFGTEEYISSTHTIVRESETEPSKPASSFQNSATISIPSPVSIGQITGSNSVTTCSNPVCITTNSITMSAPATFSTKQYNDYLSLSQEMSLNELNLELFTNSNWDTSLSNACSSTSAEITESSATVVSWPVSTATHTPSSITTTFAPDMTLTTPSVIPSPSVNSNHSPAASTTPNVSTSTPFSNSFPFSPLTEHNDENTVSPLNPSAASGISTNLDFASALESNSHSDLKKGNESMLSPTLEDSQVADTGRLRNLLTNGPDIGKTSSSVVPSSGECGKISDHGHFNRTNTTNSKENPPNPMLRELLNEEEDKNVISNKSKTLIERSRRPSASTSSIANVAYLQSLLTENDPDKACNQSSTSAIHEKNYMKEELMEDKLGKTTWHLLTVRGGIFDYYYYYHYHQWNNTSMRLLVVTKICNNLSIMSKEDIAFTTDQEVSSVASGSDTHRTLSTNMDDTFFKFGISLSPVNSNAQGTSSKLLETNRPMKRSMSTADDPGISELDSKRSCNSKSKDSLGGELACMNPMLAGMLNNIPQSNQVNVPQIATALISEIPQKKLPGDLEKKIVSTPVSRSGQESTVQFDLSRTPGTSNLASRLVRNDLTNNNHKENHSSGPPSYQPADSPHFLSNLLNSAPTQSGGLPSRPGSQHTNLGPPNTVAPSANNSHAIAVSGIENISASVNFNDLMNSSNINLTESEIPNKLESLQPNFFDEFTEVNSIVEILSTMEESLQPEQTLNSTTNELTETIAISAIKSDLMNYENLHTPNQSSIFNQQPPAYSISQLAPPTYTQSSSLNTISHPPHQTFQAQSQNDHAPPNYRNVNQQRPRYAAQQSLPNQIQQPVGHQYHNMSGGGVTNNIQSPQIVLLQQKQKQQQQQMNQRKEHQRLMQQQQHQQIMSRTQPSPHSVTSEQQLSSSPISLDSMSDFFGVVAPNVALQRSTSLQDSQLSPRFNNQLSNPVVTPTSQISPNQRVNQQSYPGPPPHPSSQFQQTSPASQVSPVGFFPPTPTSSSGQISPNIVQKQSHSTGSNFPQNRSQVSPQSAPLTTSQQQPQWPPVQRNNSGLLQQQNPMLNAQLNKQGPFNRQATRHPNPGNIRSVPSPGTGHSPFSQQDPFPNLQTPVTTSVSVSGNNVIFQQHQPISRMKRSASVTMPARVNSPRTPQGQYLGTGQDNILSPQPQMSSPFPHSLPSTPVSQSQSVFAATNSPTPTTAVTPASAPPAYTGGSLGRPSSNDGGQFSFEQANLQMMSGTVTSNGTAQQQSERGRNQNLSSDYVKQEIRTLIGSRSQYQSQAPVSNNAQQALPQQQQPNISLSFQPAELEALGLSLELESDLNSLHTNRAPSVGPPAHSPRMPGNNENHSDSKKGIGSSLLKQLLSE
ncbi:Nuclear receptor coactivator 2 [Nymphon striatum]|nr:Nuclear receptor coactivator 2 [Nymphon striatum]